MEGIECNPDSAEKKKKEAQDNYIGSIHEAENLKVSIHEAESLNTNCRPAASSRHFTPATDHSNWYERVHVFAPGAITM